MVKLDNFVDMMTGHCNIAKSGLIRCRRKEKYILMQKRINTVCNGKILNLPKDFNGKSVVEESYCRDKWKTPCFTTSFPDYRGRE